MLVVITICGVAVAMLSLHWQRERASRLETDIEYRLYSVGARLKAFSDLTGQLPRPRTKSTSGLEARSWRWALCAEKRAWPADRGDCFPGFRTPSPSESQLIQMRGAISY
jgi:hypothetical protein